MSDSSRGELVKTQKDNLESSLGRLRRLARLMDDQFELPIVKVRVGLDPIIGLVPGGGDWVTWVVSVYIIWEAIRMGTPVRVLLRMALNVTVDLVAGYVPGVGDLADVVIKANRRNVDLLVDYYDAEADATVPERVRVPDSAIEKFEKRTFMRYPIGIVIILVLFALAAAPGVALWWYLSQGGA